MDVARLRRSIASRFEHRKGRTGGGSEIIVDGQRVERPAVVKASAGDGVLRHHGFWIRCGKNVTKAGCDD